jgi:hypothetical protein
MQLGRRVKTRRFVFPTTLFDHVIRVLVSPGPLARQPDFNVED